MKYFADCPFCGKRLCKAEEGSVVEVQCPHSNQQVEVVVTQRSVTTSTNRCASAQKYNKPSTH